MTFCPFGCHYVYNSVSRLGIYNKLTLKLSTELRFLYISIVNYRLPIKMLIVYVCLRSFNVKK